MADPTSVAKAAGHETMNVFIDYLAPLGGLVAGLAYPIGGPSGLGNAIQASLNQGNTVSNITIRRLMGLLFGGVWGAVGLAFWRLGHRDGWIEKILGRTVGAFFFGQALRDLVVWSVMGNTETGPVDSLFTWGESLAKGG